MGYGDKSKKEQQAEKAPVEPTPEPVPAADPERDEPEAESRQSFAAVRAHRLREHLCGGAW